MPPLRSSRASRACDLCRKHKTRCYNSGNDHDPCLRCRTLSQPCSLQVPSPTEESITSRGSTSSAQPRTTDDRLERLERTFDAFLSRFDSKFGIQPSGTTFLTPQTQDSEAPPSEIVTPAPVFLIRDAATDIGVRSTREAASVEPQVEPDVISNGLISLPMSYSLLAMSVSSLLLSCLSDKQAPFVRLTHVGRFHVYYGRWVVFPETISPHALLARVRASPLLLTSIFLIAVRHTTQELSDRLAPELFKEAKRLVASSLLQVATTIEFFQAALILSLWSTTVGQEPLSIDSWLLTNYALQQAQASPVFACSIAMNTSESATSQIEACCLWNHLCLAHLQYCVGTRRRAVVTEEQIGRYHQLIPLDKVSPYEVRMVAEVQLYWIIYENSSVHHVDLARTKMALGAWKQKWSSALNQSRSHYLHMGFDFAHLLAYSQVAKTPQTEMNNAVLLEMVGLAENIITLAIDSTDERTRHLTDHIYHLVTFAAMTLLSLISSHETELRETTSHDIDALDNLVAQLIDWLLSIGPSCHVSHMLGHVIKAQYDKLRSDTGNVSHTERPKATFTGVLPEASSVSCAANDSHRWDLIAPYLDLFGADIFGVDMTAAMESSWGQMDTDADV